MRQPKQQTNKPHLTFREFVTLVNPKYQWYEHASRLADVLQRVADGEIHRLMIFMPPRHGKSEEVSRLFSAYFLYRYPDRWVGINSYAADLAFTLSRSARDNFLTAGGSIRRDAAAINHWQTTGGGGLWAAGVGGPITGKGFDLGIIDDPLKNAEEAASETIREKQKEWYRSTFYTRAEPNAASIVIQTRWHEADLSGWLLAEENSEDEQAEHWHVVSYSAVKEDSDPAFPPTCTVEPDWRQPGEALCEERYPLARLARIARRIGAYFWAALFQQRPGSRAGGVFQRAWWKWYRQAPSVFDEMVQSWDMAFKDLKTSDYVVGQVWGRKGADKFLLDQVRGRMDFPSTVQAVRLLSAKWPSVRAKLVEDKANGTAVIATLKHEIPGLIAVEPQGGKLARASAVSPDIEAGNVYLPEGAAWASDFVEECAAFPTGAYDDQVDAMSQALLRLTLQTQSGYRTRPMAGRG